MTKIAFVLSTLIAFMLYFGVSPQPLAVFAAWVFGCILILCRQLIVDAAKRQRERDLIIRDLETEDR